MGGPYWTYWLGMMILSALLGLVGLSILIAITVHPSFVIQLRGRNSKLGEIKLGERVLWYTIAPSMVLLGIVCFLVALRALLLGAHANY